jgi:hypothetical protein
LFVHNFFISVEKEFAKLMARFKFIRDFSKAWGSRFVSTWSRS